MATTYAAVVAAARCYYRRDPAMRAKMSGLLRDLFREFGWISRLFAAAGGPYLCWTARREQTRLSRGWTHEPPTFYEHNDAAHALSNAARRGGELCRRVIPRVAAVRGRTVLADGPVSEEAEAPATPVDA
jgi:hypothetical protein